MAISPADLFLSPDLTEEEARRYLQSVGFRDPAAADEHLQMMAADPLVRQGLGGMAADLIRALLEAPNPDAAVVGLSRYLAARTSRSMFLAYLQDDPKALHVITYILGASPFLSEILIRNPEYFHWLVSQIDRGAPDLIDLHDEIDRLLAAVEGPADMLDALRRFKRRDTLRIATGDLLGRESLESATAQLSDLAGVLVDRALAIVVVQMLEAEGRDESPGAFAVIGMGKLGGRELNYSSDIDLIYVYEPTDREDPSVHDFFQRLGRKLTAALGEHTDESYLYRVDLRLRPMGRTGNISASIEQCGQYYSAWGETFERFALIKARPIAGDLDLGRRFVEMVQPFVYRKYLDHAAMEEMHRYKARTERALQAAGADRNVKSGRGGIREVEGCAQVLQLIHGGTQPTLRQPNTLTALAALRDAGIIAEEVRADLAAAYAFLRAVEHRLQLVQEAQTHTLSDSAAELEISARRLSLSSVGDLDAQLSRHRDRVHEIYRDLLEHKRGATSFGARQLFRLLSDDVPEAEAQAQLAEMGLPNPAGALAVIRSLAASASGSHAPSVARNLLANLLSVLLTRIAGCARPEQVLNRFDQLVAASGAAMRLFRRLLEDEGLRDLLIHILDSGDLVAQRLVRYPELFDSLGLPVPDAAPLRQEIDAELDRVDELDRPARMGAIRRLKLFQEFKILVEWLAGGTLDAVQEKLSRLADACVERAARWQESEQPGLPPWAIVALGKLGGLELTVHSDLDLVVLYGGDPDDSATFERHQLFVQSMEAFLETPTGEGVAYKVDTRLRPEGSKGALAIPVVMFRRYLQTRAEIWERMAWTRCRFVAGSVPLADEIQSAVAGFVYGPWDPRMPGYADYVRGRMERELAHESERRVDFKIGRGGLADIDFALQLIQIREGGDRPEFRMHGSRMLLSALPPTPYLDSGEVEQIRDAYQFLRHLEIVTRMEADSNVSWIDPHTESLNPLGIRMGFSVRPGERLLQRYIDATSRVRSIYKAVLGRLAP